MNQTLEAELRRLVFWLVRLCVLHGQNVGTPPPPPVLAFANVNATR